MVENWQDIWKTGNMIDTSKNTSMTSGEAGSKLTYMLIQVGGDGTFDPATEDEITEVENLFAEPKKEKVSVDAVLCYDNGNPVKCLGIEEFPGSLDHNNQLTTDSGALLSNISREWSEASNFEFLDGMLQGVDEEDLHVSNVLSSSCDDYLLDTEFVEKAPDLTHGTCEGPRSANLSFENCSPTLGEQDAKSAQILYLSASTIPVLEPTSDQSVLLLDTMTVQELQKAFKSTFGRETTVTNKQWLISRISFGLQNFVELKNVSSLSESGISYMRNDKDMLFTCNNDSNGMYSSFTNVVVSKGKRVNRNVPREKLAGVDSYKTSYSEANHTGLGFLSSTEREDKHVTRKRLRKPTRRYVEETTDIKSRCCSGKLETPITSTKDKSMLSRSYDQRHRKEFVAIAPVCKQDSFGRSQTQAPCGLGLQKRGEKKTSFWEHSPGNNKNDRIGLDPSYSSDFEPSPTESQDEISDDCVSTVRKGKRQSRRKNHRSWTLPEVMKLIDGVSQYGVGRWTDIKRLLFDSSAHRTSVDLKDKWRNLLRASGSELKKKRKVEKAPKQNATCPIPQSVLQRVSELAIIYPYPRDRTAKFMPKLTDKITSKALVSTEIHAASGGDTSVRRKGRIVHRKSITRD